MTDAILLTRNIYCLADLSMCPVFRRRWPSIYEAVQDSRPQRHKLMQLYLEQMPANGRPILCADHTDWPRPDAVTLLSSDDRTSPNLGVRQPPKPRVKSPGWPTGKCRTRRTRYPVVKKRTPRPKKPLETPSFRSHSWLLFISSPQLSPTLVSLS